MELGEKLKQARLEAGLSQRQLCGGEITRNMLSLIEHGSAKPSMKTLQYLAGRLGKNVSYFLEEAVVDSPNQGLMEAARKNFDAGDFGAAAEQLALYQGPDGIYDREKKLLWVLCHLALAEAAIEQRRDKYALELLERADIPTEYCREALTRRRLLLRGRIRGQQVSHQLPSLDEELLLRAEEALKQHEVIRALHLLEAMESRDTAKWHLLRGECALAREEYREAAEFFHGAEEAYPKESAAMLEVCYRELQDYRRAYEYACKQRER